MLWQAFNSFFFAQPSFLEKYPGISDVTLSVNFPFRGQGKFAFVEFVDDVIASTALCMDGFELHGRPIIVSRPQMYAPPPDGEAPALDVQVPHCAVQEGGSSEWEVFVQRMWEWELFAQKMWSC